MIWAELVWAETVLLYVGFTVDAMLRKVAAAYDATIFSTDTAPNRGDALLTVEPLETPGTAVFFLVLCESWLQSEARYISVR